MDTVRRKLSVGLTFVSKEALIPLRTGRAWMPTLLVAACEGLEAGFVYVPSDEAWSAEAADRITQCGSDVLWVVSGPFGSVAHRDGWTETLRRSARDVSALAADLDALMPELLEAVRYGARLGVATIVIAEDLAGTDGMLVSPDFALDELIPRCARLAEEAAQNALPSVFHSDGDTRALLPAIRAAGFSSVHPGGLDAETFEHFFDAARELDLVVLGGIDGESLRGDGGDSGDDAQAASAGARAAALAQAGGLLICDDGGITTLREFAALARAFQVVKDAAAGKDSPCEAT